MANDSNLVGKGFDERTAEEQRAIARQGGIASGEARRRKRDLRQALEMLRRIEPETVLFYGDMIDGLGGNIIKIPSFYAQKRESLNERKREKNGKRQQRT